MPEKYIAQYESKADNCVYFLNADTGKIQKICDIQATKDIPEDVVEYFTRVAKAFNAVIPRGLQQ
jgi:hypothetical protein